MKGIYKIENKVNGKVYVGQSKDIEKRWKEHKAMLKKNNHHSIKLQRAWNKYGADNFDFSVIELTNKVINLDDMERKYMQQYDSVVNGYNMTGVDDVGNFTNEKSIAAKKKRELQEQYYILFIDLFNKFDGDLEINGSYYNCKLFSKTASYKEYMKAIKLMLAMYGSYYQKGEAIEMNYIFRSLRIRCINKQKTFFLASNNKVKVYNNLSLNDNNMDVVKLNDLINGNITDVINNAN